jgi:oligo-1,6-glucosidase/alpha-glucosidase
MYPEPYSPVYLFGNHDRKRLISIIGEDFQKAKLLAMFQFTVRGVPVTYYGEEIGMSEVSIPAREGKDPIAQRYRWVPNFLTKILNLYLNRDGCRTPMQWDESAHAGFCHDDAIPWMPVHENFKRVNVKTQSLDSSSLLNTYKRLLHLRKQSTVMQEGHLQILDSPEEILAYIRENSDEQVLVLLNFGSMSINFENRTKSQKILFKTGAISQKGAENIEVGSLSGAILSS